MALKLSFAIMAVIGLMFLPTTIFLLIGMSPTLAALAMDRTPGRSKTLCVGAMNFAGCFPFLLEFWTGNTEQSITESLRMISNMQTLITIFILAAGGYAIDKAVTGIASSILIQRAETRLKSIIKEQTDLTKRWGEKVTGQYKLDEYGFPINPIPDASQKNNIDGD